MHGEDKKAVFIGRCDKEETAFIRAKKEAMKLSENACFFCDRETAFALQTRGKVKDKPLMVERIRTNLVRQHNGEWDIQRLHGRVQVPDTWTYLNVISCPDCVDKLDKVVYNEGNMVREKWTKTTGARAQHFARSVPVDRRHEGKSDAMDNGFSPEPNPEDPSHRIISRNRYFESIKVSE
jgi:hypothetical protein